MVREISLTNSPEKVLVDDSETIHGLLNTVIGGLMVKSNQYSDKRKNP